MHISYMDIIIINYNEYLYFALWNVVYKYAFKLEIKTQKTVNIKALGLVVSDKKIFSNCILKKNLFLTPWPTYATNWNNLNNFGRGPPRDLSCEVRSKSNERFQSRRCLSKKVYARRTTHDGRRTKDCHKSSLWAICAQVS